MMWNKEQAWWLPPKSVRASLAWFSWGLTAYLLVKGMEVPEGLWAMNGTTTAFYFAGSNS